MTDSKVQKSSDASLRITILLQVMYSILEPLRQFWDNACTSIIVILMHRIYDNFATESTKIVEKKYRNTKKNHHRS